MAASSRLYQIMSGKRVVARARKLKPARLRAEKLAARTRKQVSIWRFGHNVMFVSGPRSKPAVKRYSKRLSKKARRTSRGSSRAGRFTRNARPRRRRSVRFRVRMGQMYGLKAPPRSGHTFGGSGFSTKAEALKEARYETKELGVKVRVVKLGGKRRMSAPIRNRRRRLRVRTSRRRSSRRRSSRR